MSTPPEECSFVCDGGFYPVFARRIKKRGARQLGSDSVDAVRSSSSIPAVNDLRGTDQGDQVRREATRVFGGRFLTIVRSPLCGCSGWSARGRFAAFRKDGLLRF